MTEMKLENENPNLDLVELSLQNIISTLDNKQPKIKKDLHVKFLRSEQENAAFLISRVVRFNPKYSNYLMQALLICKTAHRQDPTFWLARDMLYTVTKLNPTNIQANPVVSSYPTEFPQAVLDGDLVVSTRVIVAEALASWSFFNKDQLKIQKIVEVGLKRFDKIQDKKIKLVKKKLNEESEFLIYFTTHLVLVATMWGEIKWESPPQKLIDNCLRWVSFLEPVAETNLEIWLELLFCLQVLGNLSKVDKNVKDKLQNTESILKLFKNPVIILDPHESYHLFVLWALFLVSIEKLS